MHSQSAVFTLIPLDNPQQALRLRRFFIAGGSYLMMIGLMVLAGWLNLLNEDLIVAIAATSVVFNLVMYAVFRSGFNLKFKDPSLTAVQVMAALTMASYGMYFANTSRGVFLLVYLVIILFGVFRLTTRELLYIGIYALACYGVVIGLARHYKPDITNLEVELLQWAVLGAILPWFALIGGYLNNLRRDMRDQNRQLQSALATIQEMATHDELTGVYNRRYLMDRLQQEKTRSDRGKGTLCVCMLDIDFFKKVNDNYGHLAGDKVLRVFAKVSQTGLRATDCFARYGGEEFALLLADTALDGAVVLADRIRGKIEAIEFDDLGIAGVTASVGIAQYYAPEDIMTTLARADAALYRAKTGGRNRVECMR